MVSRQPSRRRARRSPLAEPAVRAVVVFCGAVTMALLGLVIYAGAVVITMNRDPIGPVDSQGITQPFLAPDGASYTQIPRDPTAAPAVEIIPLERSTSGSAIWGSLGRDHRGHIWVGVSTHGYGSAQLLEVLPGEGRVIPRGDAINALKTCGEYQRHTSQVKIHTRIVQAPDGYLYFASMDEEGENPKTETLPLWGSHLWRLHPDKTQWEHLARTRRALTALSCASRYVYALGYFGHVLVQYDTRAGGVRSIRVGSLGGHNSRNVLSDRRGHVYVPRLEAGASPKTKPVVWLVEFDTHLVEVARTPIPHYLGVKRPVTSQGITAFQHMVDGSIVFVTHEGYLYRITLPPDGSARPASVAALGFFHPDGARYVTSMHTHAGKRYLLGVAKTPKGAFEWLTYDLESRQATNTPLDFQYDDGRIISKHLLYGSIARDHDGQFFAVGTDMQIDKPVLLRLIRSP